MKETIEVPIKLHFDAGLAPEVAAIYKRVTERLRLETLEAQEVVVTALIDAVAWALRPSDEPEECEACGEPLVVTVTKRCPSTIHKNGDER